MERSDPTIHAGPAAAPRAPHALCVDLLAIKANERVDVLAERAKIAGLTEKHKISYDLKNSHHYLLTISKCCY